MKDGCHWVRPSPNPAQPSPAHPSLARKAASSSRARTAQVSLSAMVRLDEWASIYGLYGLYGLYGPLWCIQFPDIMGTIIHTMAICFIHGVKMPWPTWPHHAAPGDGGIGPYLHRFRRFILFAWGPLLSEISGDRKKCRNSVGHALLSWKMLELMRTTAKKKHGIVGELFVKDCSETTGNWCCFIEWRCVWDITSHAQHSTLQNLCSLNASESCSCSRCVHRGCWLYVIHTSRCRDVHIYIYDNRYYNVYTPCVYIYVYRACSSLCHISWRVVS